MLRRIRLGTLCNTSIGVTRHFETVDVWERLGNELRTATQAKPPLEGEELPAENEDADTNGQEMVDISSLVRRKNDLVAAIEHQKQRRLANRQAFQLWQAGQREKGAAMRLERQARKAEGFKRRQATALKDRLLQVSYYSPQQRWNSTNEWSDDAMEPHLRGQMLRHERSRNVECNYANIDSEASIFLKLSRR